MDDLELPEWDSESQQTQAFPIRLIHVSYGEPSVDRSNCCRYIWPDSSHYHFSHWRPEMKHFEITVDDTIGRLAYSTRELNYQGVNILGVYAGQLDGNGHIAFLTNDSVRASRIMTEAGLVFKERDVAIVRLEHISGSLHRAANVLAEKSINISYIYPIVQSPPGVPMVFRTDDVEKAIAAFEEARFRVVEF